jgi:hypothetical protein
MPCLLNYLLFGRRSTFVALYLSKQRLCNYDLNFVTVQKEECFIAKVKDIKETLSPIRVPSSIYCLSKIQQISVWPLIIREQT